MANKIKTKKNKYPKILYVSPAFIAEGYTSLNGLIFDTNIENGDVVLVYKLEKIGKLKNEVSVT